MVNPEILKDTLDFLIKEFKDVSGVKYGQPESSDRIHYLLFNEARAYLIDDLIAEEDDEYLRWFDSIVAFHKNYFNIK